MHWSISLNRAPRARREGTRGGTKFSAPREPATGLLYSIAEDFAPLKVTLERLPESRIQLDIEVDQDRVDKQFEAALKRLAPRARVAGFRPGKAPRHLVERALGHDRIMGEALDKLVPDVYNEAIEGEAIDAIDQPNLDKLEMEPVRLKFTVAVRPTVDLGDYRTVRVERQPAEVTDEAIAEQMLLLRRRHATHVPVERPVQWDDVLLADISATVEGDDFVKDEDAEFTLREGQPLLLDGLAEAFLGMNRGETKSVDIAIPDDFRSERLQSKTATFILAIKEVKEEQLPDEDDELAAMINAEEFETIDALRDRLRSDMTKQLEAQEEARYRGAAIEMLVEGATFDYPPVLVEREIDHMIQDLMGNNQQQYAAYLQTVGRSESEYRDTLREAANIRLRRSLAVSRLAEVEKLEVTPDDVEAEVDRLVEPMGEDALRFREMFSTLEGIATIRRNLTSAKTLKRLVAIAAGEAPELPAEVEALAEAATKEDAPA